MLDITQQTCRTVENKHATLTLDYVRLSIMQLKLKGFFVRQWEV